MKLSYLKSYATISFAVVAACTLFAGCKKDHVKPATVNVTTLVGNTHELFYPTGIVADANGNLYVCDEHMAVIHKVTPGGAVTTLAGSGATYGDAHDGIGTHATFIDPTAITFDNQGNLLVTDATANSIRKVTLSGVVTTVPVIKSLTGNSTVTLPVSVAVDADNNIYTANFEHITKLDAGGTLTIFADAVKQWTITGKPGEPDETIIGWAHGIKADQHGNLFVIYSNVICSIDKNGRITPVAGAPQSGYQDGKGTAAKFKNPSDLAIDNAGNIYVTDTGNHLIRKIAGNGEVTTIAGDVNTTQSIDGTGAHAGFDKPGAICIDKNGVLYVTDADQLREIVIE